MGKGHRRHERCRHSARPDARVQTRPAFRARLTCTRASKTAQCIPVLPITLTFNAPVARAEAEKVMLRGADGKTYPAIVDQNDNFVQRVGFNGPVPGKGRVQDRAANGAQG